MSHVTLTSKFGCTRWRCLWIIFPQKSPAMGGSFAERDLHLVRQPAHLGYPFSTHVQNDAFVTMKLRFCKCDMTCSCSCNKYHVPICIYTKRCILVHVLLCVWTNVHRHIYTMYVHISHVHNIYRDMHYMNRIHVYLYMCTCGYISNYRGTHAIQLHT